MALQRRRFRPQGGATGGPYRIYAPEQPYPYGQPYGYTPHVPYQEGGQGEGKQGGAQGGGQGIPPGGQVPQGQDQGGHFQRNWRRYAAGAAALAGAYILFSLYSGARNLREDWKGSYPCDAVEIVEWRHHAEKIQGGRIETYIGTYDIKYRDYGGALNSGIIQTVGLSPERVSLIHDDLKASSTGQILCVEGADFSRDPTDLGRLVKIVKPERNYKGKVFHVHPDYFMILVNGEEHNVKRKPLYREGRNL